VLEQAPDSPRSRAQPGGKPRLAGRSANVLAGHCPYHGPARLFFAVGWGFPAEIWGRSRPWLVGGAPSPLGSGVTAESGTSTCAKPAVASARAPAALLSNCAVPASSPCPDPENPALLLQRIAAPERIGFTTASSSEERALGAEAEPLDAEAVATDFALWQRLLAPLLHQSLLGLAGPLSRPCSAVTISAPCSWPSRPKAWFAGNEPRSASAASSNLGSAPMA